MPSTTNDTLARAIEALGAVEIAPGKYAMQGYGENPDGTERPNAWWIIGDPVAYWGSHSIIGNIEMPAWWEPNKQIMVIHRHASHSPCSNTCERITADLNTGEEVPA